MQFIENKHETTSKHNSLHLLEILNELALRLQLESQLNSLGRLSGLLEKCDRAIEALLMNEKTRSENKER